MPSPHEVVDLPLEQLSLHDHTFMFRAAIRVGALRRSIEAIGQQTPITVRPGADGYQVISGFRRLRCLRDLDRSTVRAVIRTDLLDDAAAYTASVCENTARKTYSDIDRAIAIKRFEQAGLASLDAASMMGLSKRQKNRLKSLLTLPPSIQAAIDDPEQPFSASHGIVLRKLRSRYPTLKYARWVAETNESALSVAALERRVHATHRQSDPPQPSMFRSAETDPEAGTFRLQSIKIDIAELTETERTTLLAELEVLRTRLLQTS
jgi:ParB/RepB/Spo0J family partition protein